MQVQCVDWAAPRSYLLRPSATRHIRTSLTFFAPVQVAGMSGTNAEAARSVVADSTWLALQRIVKEGGGPRSLFAVR